MHHQHIENLPARLRLLNDFSDGLFGHAGIVLERHAGNCTAVVHVAYHPDKSGDRANLRVILPQQRDFAPGIEILRLYTNPHLSPQSREEKTPLHRRHGPAYRPAPYPG